MHELALHAYDRDIAVYAFTTASHIALPDLGVVGIEPLAGAVGWSVHHHFRVPSVDALSDPAAPAHTRLFGNVESASSARWKCTAR